jgi:subtilisin-like proprotein convertase family protein
MLRSKRRSLLCCLLALLLFTAFIPGYAKKPRRKKKRQKIYSTVLLAPAVARPERDYISFALTPADRPVVDWLPQRSFNRATRLPGVHALPVHTVQAVNASQQSFSNGSPIEISAVNQSSDPEPVVPYSSDIDVLGLTGVVTKVSVTLNGLTHSAPDDLDMLLVSPNGKAFHFWSDVGGDNPVSDITVTVSDDGATPLPDSAALVDRTTYKPFNADTTGDDFPVPAIGPPYGEPADAGSATFASMFNGLTADEASGTWSLFITDDTDGNGGTIARGWSLNISTAVPQTTTGQLVISEFRLSGPNGPDDEFIELYNTTGARLIVQAADDSSGLGVAASDGITRCTIPNGTVIPANGHYLCAHTGASLSVEADNVYETGIADNAGLAIFNNSTGGESYSLANRIDAVGASSEKNPVYREGAGYSPIETNTLNYSFYRDLRPAGQPKDTNDNAADFLFVDTSATDVGAGQRLGAPGPESLAGPIQHNSDVTASLMAPCTAASSEPNRIRDFTSNAENNSTFGTLSIRRAFTNNTANDITRLRFRIIDITTAPAPQGTADLRVLSSSDSTEVDRCNLGGLIDIAGLTLETPPVQTLGGGFNSTLAAGVVNLETPLQPGSTITVNFLLGVQQTGHFRFFVNVEALP